MESTPKCHMGPSPTEAQTAEPGLGQCEQEGSLPISGWTAGAPARGSAGWGSGRSPGQPARNPPRTTAGVGGGGCPAGLCGPSQPRNLRNSGQLCRGLDKKCPGEIEAGLQVSRARSGLSQALRGTSRFLIQTEPQSQAVPQKYLSKHAEVADYQAGQERGGHCGARGRGTEATWCGYERGPGGEGPGPEKGPARG